MNRVTCLTDTFNRHGLHKAPLPGGGEEELVSVHSHHSSVSHQPHLVIAGGRPEQCGHQVGTLGSFPCISIDWTTVLPLKRGLIAKE